MLRWAAVCFVIAIVAGVLGLLGILESAAGLAKLLFFGFLVLATVSLIMGRHVRA
jgi:uncharacterized membrane protein YtjA (UPF0391 family)